MERPQSQKPRWLRITIPASAAVFIFVLFIAAVFQPNIRLLHALQALIYVAVILLARRDSAWGYGAGCFISGAWNFLYIKGMAGPLWGLITGRLFSPDLAIVLVAIVAHFFLMIACITACLRLTPPARRWIEFLAGGSLTLGYFVLIIVTAAPPYVVPLLKRVLGL
jgi:hypothetical protein